MARRVRAMCWRTFRKKLSANDGAPETVGDVAGGIKESPATAK